ncbi:MAG: acetate--CoA ligase family protein [Ferrimicrobium sp.]
MGDMTAYGLQIAPANSLSKLFEPSSLVVIGASANPYKWGNRVLALTVESGFQGRLFGVNPSPGGIVINGVQVVASLDEIPGEIDLAMVTLPAELVTSAVEHCGDRGVGVVVIPSSGFSELGETGRESEQRIMRTARESGMRILGPNCIGVFCAHSGVGLLPRRDIPHGDIAIATQSGNFSIAVFGEARAAGIGLSSCVGVGNQIDISLGELLSYYASDDWTRAVGLYVEGIPRGFSQHFLDGMEACAEAGKPVVILKSGASQAGAQVAHTHTSSLAADDRLWDAALRRYGAIRSHSVQDMVDFLTAATRVKCSYGRSAVLTDGGGDSVMATDALDQVDLGLAQLSTQTQERLEKLIPTGAPRMNGSNPATLDTPGGLQDSPMLLSSCARVVADDAGVDVIVIGGVFGGYRDHRDEELSCVEELIRVHRNYKPIMVQSAYCLSDEEPIVRLKEAGIAVYPTIQRLVAALATRTSVRDERTAEGIADRPEVQDGGRQIPIEQAAAMLRERGVLLPEFWCVRNVAELAAVIECVPYPACLKLADPEIIHKSDVGGVRLGLVDGAALQREAEKLWDDFPGSLLQLMPMLSSGFEILVGTIDDPTFGPTVVVGRGGIWTEVDPDVSMELAPIDLVRAEQAILRLRMAPALQGGRGQAPLDIAALASLLVQVGSLALEERDLSVDLNPVFLYSSGYAVADLRIVTRRSESSDD